MKFTQEVHEDYTSHTRSIRSIHKKFAHEVYTWSIRSLGSLYIEFAQEVQYVQEVYT